MSNQFLKVVFENESVVVVDKPSGWLSRPSRMGERETRPIASVEVAKTHGETWIVHRLDAEVSGLLVFARTKLAHRLLSYIWEKRQIKRVYHALTHFRTGAVFPLVGTTQSWQGKIAEGKRRSFFAEHGKDCITLARFQGYVHCSSGSRRDRFAFWELEPVSGRRHQLRVELASRGFPIVGDNLYGAESEKWNGGIALRAVRIGILDQPTREKLHIPDYFSVSDSFEPITTI